MTTAVHARPGAPARTADRIGRGLLLLAAVSSVAAFVGGLATMAAAPPDRPVVEGWRTFGFLVFTGLWVLLALRPRTSPGLWELVFLHKIAMVVLTLAVLDVPEAATALVVDATLVVVTAIAYVLTRGWLSWTVWRDTPA
ncbi:hypothetical protein EV188_112187 [Actinomycetospora succinea]|uniref:Uncharacterized protein n=1 Tax=Actinomycetospora succinea TaxID=663603 RepID=A0A4R6UWI0_9PSEU|nr:hypothetical protein [Actinomycetospora succinea]TDQ47914.1 hypothetical protein EV188_112187 [Actinomycetospora succinea]